MLPKNSKPLYMAIAFWASCAVSYTTVPVPDFLGGFSLSDGKAGKAEGRTGGSAVGVHLDVGADDGAGGAKEVLDVLPTASERELFVMSHETSRVGIRTGRREKRRSESKRTHALHKEVTPRAALVSSLEPRKLSGRAKLTAEPSATASDAASEPTTWLERSGSHVASATTDGRGAVSRVVFAVLHEGRSFSWLISLEKEREDGPRG